MNVGRGDGRRRRYRIGADLKGAGLVGFMQWPHVHSGVRDGVVIGILSGVSWAMASIVDTETDWSSFLNLFAALLASMSVGYLAPAKAVCVPTAAGWDTLPILRMACDIRQRVTAIGHTEMFKEKD